MQIPDRSERIASLLAGSVALAALIVESQFFASHGIFKAVGLAFATVIYGFMRGRFSKIDLALVAVKASSAELGAFRFYENATYIHIFAFLSAVGYLVFVNVGPIIATITAALIMCFTIALYRKAAECELIARKYGALSV